MQKPKIECIYLDMDGVIADFTKRYKQLYHMDPREAEKNNKWNHFFDEFISSGQFATLDKMPGADKGIEFLRKASVPTQILSSTANEEKYDAISKQKMIWLQTHGITFNPIFVPGKKHKYKYANPNSIIIDDTKSVIEDWNNAGGIGIWHKDWPTTLAILRLYV
jgi:hypothetical protein